MREEDEKWMEQEIADMIAAQAEAMMKGAPKTLGDAWGIDSPKKVTFEEEESLIESQTYLFPETEFIWHLGKSSDHSQLLLHPVIHLFIKLKVTYNRFPLYYLHVNNFR